MILYCHKGDEKMRKKVCLTVCGVWFSLLLIQLIIALCILKYPALDPQFYGFLIPLNLCLPVIATVFTLLSSEKRKLFKWLSVGFTAVGVLNALVFLTFTTWFFHAPVTTFYPMISYTEDADDYLKVEKDIGKQHGDYLERFFPEEIPREATDIRYEYYRRIDELEFRVVLEYTLPEADFIRLKQQTERDEYAMLREEDGSMFYEYFYEVDATLRLRLRFDENLRRICYRAEHFNDC